MLHAERQQFIEKELKELWPRWNWSLPVQQAWFKVLAPWEYKKAKVAVREIYIQATVKFQNGLIPAMRGAMRSHVVDTDQFIAPEDVLDSAGREGVLRAMAANGNKFAKKMLAGKEVNPVEVLKTVQEESFDDFAAANPLENDISEEDIDSL